MTYTTHGHHIIGTIKTEPPSKVARCGGPGLCDQCSNEAEIVKRPNQKKEDSKVNTPAHNPSPADWKDKLKEAVRPVPEGFETQKFARKPFYIDAVQVTEENMEAVAKWCGGTISVSGRGDKYIDVDVHAPQTERQKKAFVNDWVLYADFAHAGFKVYTPVSFKNTFVPAKEE